MQRTLQMSSLAQRTLESFISSQNKIQIRKRHSETVYIPQGTVEPSRRKTGPLGSTQGAHRMAQIFPSNKGAEKHSLSLRRTMGLPKSETRTLKFYRLNQDL